MVKEMGNMTSLSRQLARFAVGLSADALPPAVVDKVKACTLHALATGMLGAGTPRGRAAIRLAREEEARPDGATVLVDGTRVTRMGAVFANSELMHASGQEDSYLMLTHPGSCIVPAALATAEMGGKSGREFMAALVAGYEVEARIAKSFIPSTQARGFRSSAVYGVFGASVATGKLLGLNQDQMVGAIALAATMAAGTLEGAREGGGESVAHEPNAARCGVLAALLAMRENFRGSETALEGEAGFYHAFTGNNKGRLSYVFTGPKRVDLASVTEGLGQHYEMSNVTFKIYATAGYNNPVIDLMAALKRQHAIDPDHVEEITVEMNWLETLYPSPAFPRQQLAEPGVGTTHYFAAYACVEGGYPMHGDRMEDGLGHGGQPLGQDSRITGLMKRVRVIGVKGRKSFAPKITITTKQGASYTGEFSGEEFRWGFEGEVQRLQGLVPGLPVPKEVFGELVGAVNRIDEASSVNGLLQTIIVT